MSPRKDLLQSRTFEESNCASGAGSPHTGSDSLGIQRLRSVDHLLHHAKFVHVEKLIHFLSPRETTDEQISVFVDQEFASMCLRLYRKMRSFLVLAKIPPGAYVLLTARHRSAVSLTDFGFFVVGALGISMNLGKVLASTGSSYAGSANVGGLEDSNVVTTLRRAWHSMLPAPILLVLEDGVLMRCSSGLLEVSYPQILAHTDCALET